MLKVSWKVGDSVATLYLKKKNNWERFGMSITMTAVNMHVSQSR